MPPQKQRSADYENESLHKGFNAYRVDKHRRGHLTKHGHDIDQGHTLSSQLGGKNLRFSWLHAYAQPFYLHCELEACVHGIGCKESGNHCQDSLGN